MVLYHSSKLKQQRRALTEYMYYYIMAILIIPECSSYLNETYARTETLMLAYQSMTPEDSESLMMAPRSANAVDEKPVHVRGQPPKKTKASCPNTGIHMAMTMDPMTPASPRWNLTVMSHDRTRWRPRLSTAR